MVEVKDIRVGCVVRVVIGGYEKRVQVVGLDNEKCKGGRKPGEFRGFILHSDEKPRPFRGARIHYCTCRGVKRYLCPGDEFINFRISNCREVEAERYQQENDHLGLEELRAALAL